MLPRAPVALVLLALAACTDRKPADSAPPGETAAPDSVPPDSGETADSRETAETAETAETGDTDTVEPPPPPIVVVVLADDLGDNYLWGMPTVMDRLAPDCVRFTRAYSTVPLCCPVRASFLAGGAFPAETGVHTNDYPNGGIAFFHDADTLATRLQGAGFRTAILGKYLNGYEDGVAPYVPPGWDLFLVPTSLGDGYDATLIRGSSTPEAPGEGVAEGTGGAHLTGWLFDEALGFLDAYPDEPTFVFLAPQSPHIYGSPATEDIGTYASFSPRPRSFAEADVSDKPRWIQRANTPIDDDFERWDAEARLMMDNLVSLDRAMGALLDGLDDRGLLDRTVLVFAGDNGHLHGEHRLASKGVAYEESVHVPVLIRAPGTTPGEDNRLVAMNLDLPATIADLAGLPASGWGESLGPALLDPTTPDARDHVFLETSVGDHPVWAGVVTERWKYVEWGTGELELYDLDVDPAELDSLHAAPPADADLAQLAAWTDAHRALAVTTRAGDPGTVGLPYTATLEAWGGTPPLTWSVDTGVLPPGLALASDGTLAGTPTTAGGYSVLVRVTDSVASPVTGEPATFAQTLGFSISAGARLLSDVSADVSPVSLTDVVGPTVTFRVNASPGAVVRFEASLDDTRDTPPVRSALLTANVAGLATATVPLDPTRTWHWRAVIDGVPIRGGVLPPARRVPQPR
ncbi:MAG: sulfatase-like hydrolase/transferase [Pseudomonadota bacterium]|nr:sulfatase-like hydrolase/transferase [Pseudomonadota bacterium]